MRLKNCIETQSTRDACRALITELTNHTWQAMEAEQQFKVKLVLTEMLANALVHGNQENEEKRIVVRWDWFAEVSRLWIEVQDEGQGFDDLTLEKSGENLFENTELSESGRGMGIIRELADEVQLMDKGRRIRVGFFQSTEPCRREHEKPVWRSKVSKILIVDDEEINLKIVKRFLAEERDLELRTAHDGESAMICLEEFLPDLIIMDIFMPGQSGIDVTRKIRAQFQNLQMPIILITASFDFALKMEALESGVDDFLNKPLDRIELITKVRLLLKNKHLHELIDQQNKSMLHQLSLARMVQNKLQFRGNYQFGSIGLEASYFPMEAIGGDIIALRKTCQDRLWVFLGDASGHGISAAMVGTLIRALLEGLPENLSCSEVMTALNDKLVDCFDGDLDDLYVTAVFCVVDLKENLLTWVNAGHPAPYIKVKGTAPEEALHLPLGVMREVSYTSQSIRLEDMNEMVLYSDGLLSMIGSDLEQAQISVSSGEMIRKLIEKRTIEREEGIGHDDDLAIVRMTNKIPAEISEK